MKQIRTRTLLKTVFAVLFLTIAGLIVWETGKKKIGTFRSPPSPRGYSSNDSLFRAETSDFLIMKDGVYLMSASPIFELSDALNLFPLFDENSAFISVFTEYPQSQDKDYSITWKLWEERLAIWNIEFLYRREEVNKHYPDFSFLEPIARANEEFWRKNKPGVSPPDWQKWTGERLYASWYTGVLYVKKVEYSFADSVQTNSLTGAYKEGFPVLKLTFQDGIVKSCEEFWQKKEKLTSPLPDPFEK